VLLERHSGEAELKKGRALRDLRELLKHSREGRLMKIERAASRFRGLTLVHLLLAEARRHIPAEPQEVFELAEAAEAVLLRTAHAPGYFDALARAMAYKGNSLRATGKMKEADEYLRQARNLIRHQDITDTQVYAEADWLEGVLRKDQRYFEEAEDLLSRSAALFQLAGETVEATRPLLALALMYDEAGDLARASNTTMLALGNLGPGAEPHLHCYARHNLTLFLCDAGRFEEAAESLAAYRDLYRKSADRYTESRLGWLEGKIALGLGRTEEAEEALSQVRGGFLEQGNGYDAAMVSLDLALLYLGQSRMAELREVAEEIYRVFTSENIQREALSALLLFHEAVRQEEVTAELIGKVAGHLRRARRDPAR
jgi:tetratricopeptide (TPR) repeat protein